MLTVDCNILDRVPVFAEFSELSDGCSLFI